MSIVILDRWSVVVHKRDCSNVQLALVLVQDFNLPNVRQENLVEQTLR